MESFLEMLLDTEVIGNFEETNHVLLHLFHELCSFDGAYILIGVVD